MKEMDVFKIKDGDDSVSHFAFDFGTHSIGHLGACFPTCCAIALLAMIFLNNYKFFFLSN